MLVTVGVPPVALARPRARNIFVFVCSCRFWVGSGQDKSQYYGSSRTPAPEGRRPRPHPAYGTARNPPPGRISNNHMPAPAPAFVICHIDNHSNPTSEVKKRGISRTTSPPINPASSNRKPIFRASPIKKPPTLGRGSWGGNWLLLLVVDLHLEFGIRDRTGRIVTDP